MSISFEKYIKLIFFILLSCQIIAQDIVWTNNTPLIRSYSSPRTTDLNNDGISDMVIGGGVDGFPSPYGVIAIDGFNGNTIWTLSTRNEMFASPQFFDYNGDNTDDVLIAGRDAELRLINGSTGELIWEFWDSNDENFNDAGWYNFYTPQIIEDQTGDGIPDILAANGGDHSLDFSIVDRPPGHIMIIDGSSGSEFKTAVVPDSNETYLSPIISDLNNDGDFSIIFGTGGEGVAGNLWIANLSDLIQEDLSSAIPLVPNSELGHIAPPSIGDLNGDDILDIITQGFDGKITAINGLDLSVLWQYEIENTESSASPILGKFSSTDNNIDVFATIYSGSMSTYDDYYQVLLDGETGSVLWSDSLGMINFCTPIAFDSNVDGNDEVLISVINHNGSYFENDLILIDFTENSQESIIGPIPGGNIASTPQITDIDNNGLLDIICSVQADSLDPFGDGTFYENGINSFRISTSYTLPESEISWGSYMGTNFDGHYNNGCEGDLGLFAFPSQVCPGENNGMINLFISNGTPPYSYLWSNGETTEDLENIGPGLYTVTVTDATGLCETISREVDEYGLISFSQAPSCPGGEDGLAYFNSSGCDCNTSFCQFIWVLNGDTIAQGDGSTAAETYKYLTGIESGTYTATIIHPDGCEVQEDIIVPEGAIVNNYNITNDCTDTNNGSIELISQDTTLTYLWNNGETTSSIFNLEPAAYNVVVTDTTNCIDTMYFNIESFFPYDCDGNCLLDSDSDGVCDQNEVAGCTDDTACNYDTLATDDDGSCVLPVGCETCSGETDGTGTVLANDADNDGVCDGNELAGCQDELACNYNANATDSDGSCVLPVGCETCSGETDGTGIVLDNDADNDGVCDENEVAGCTDDTACNYNSEATDDDGSCWYPIEGFDCDSNSSIQESVSKKSLITIIDLLGKEVNSTKDNTTLLYIYDDGSINKKHVFNK